MDTELTNFLQSLGVADADDALLDELRRVLVPRSLRSGERLYKAGADADSLGFVTHGRLVVVDEDDNTVAEIGRHELVGEVGVVAGVARTADVIAVRDSELLSLSASDFAQLAEREPSIAYALSRTVVNRLAGVGDAGERRRGPAVVTVVGVGAESDSATLLELATHAAPEASVIRPDDLLGRTDAERSLLLERAEREHAPVLIDGGSLAHPTPALSVSLRSADAIVVVVDANTGNPPQAVTERFRSETETLRSTIELVVVNPAHATIPATGGGWRRAMRPHRQHQHRVGSAETGGRLWRLILGRGTGLVLSGGAAKGLAHIGVWRALSELRIAIDAVAGVSQGALLGAGIALDKPADELAALVEEHASDTRGLVDPTFPLVSLVRGKAVTEIIRTLAEGRSFAQVWRNFVCCSCDLSSGELVDHTDGPLWQGVRASMSIPVIFPPVRVDDRLLVDGAVRNNLPIDALRRRHPGPILTIASDVGKDGGLMAGATPDSGTISGWSELRSRIRRSKDAAAPSIPQLVMRVMELAGDADVGSADHLIRPDLTGLNLADFSSLAEFDRAGYDATMQLFA